MFYDGDAARDTSHMNRLQRGGYFDIIQAQLKFGHLEGNLIQRILGNDYDICWEIIKIILKQDERSCYYVDWVDDSIKKRDLYSKSRSKNSYKGWKNRKLRTNSTYKAYARHMQSIGDAQETETETVKEDVNDKDKDVFTELDFNVKLDFNVIWDNYLKKVGKKTAYRHFKATVKTKQDFENIQKALENYKKSARVLRGFVQDGSTWFNNWQDWIDFEEAERKDIERYKAFGRQEVSNQELIDQMNRVKLT